MVETNRLTIVAALNTNKNQHYGSTDSLIGRNFEGCLGPGFITSSINYTIDSPVPSASFPWHPMIPICP